MEISLNVIENNKKIWYKMSSNLFLEGRIRWKNHLKLSEQVETIWIRCWALVSCWCGKKGEYIHNGRLRQTLLDLDSNTGKNIRINLNLKMGDQVSLLWTTCTHWLKSWCKTALMEVLSCWMESVTRSQWTA